MSPATVPVPHDEVLQRALRLRLGAYRGRRLEIRTHDVDAAPFRDGIDLLLRASGSLRPVWTDTRGRREQGGSMPAAAFRIAREIASIPAAWLRHRRMVNALERTIDDPVAPRPLERILFLRTDHAFGITAGGSVGHLAGVIDGFRRHGRHVEVVSTDHLAGVPRDDAFHLLPPVYEPVRNLPELPMLHHNRRLLEALDAFWEAVAPDLVYHRYSLDSWVGPALRARHGVPYVCEYNGPLVWVQQNWERRGPWFPRLANDIEELNLRSADLVVVVSRVLKQDAVARGVRPERVVVAPNGVDTDVYHPAVDGTGVRRRYGLEDALVVGFIGTFGQWHGAEVLARAAARLKARDAAGGVAGAPGEGAAGGPGAGSGARPIRFLLIGDGVRMPDVRRIIGEHGLEDRVTLTGLVPQAEGPAHLAACDILVSPHVPNPDGSPFFGSPTKLFEYMAMGRAIVASELEQIGEVLEHGATAWLVPPGDPDALLDGILRLAGDSALRGRLADAARERAEAEHTWLAHTRRILDGLREVGVVEETP